MANRPKMSHELRAKQFMPFAALKGYNEALSKKEQITVDKIELTEDLAELLDRKLASIKPKDIITVVYYSNNQYIKKTGIFVKLDTSTNCLQVVNLKIPLSDILDITFE